MRKNIFKYFIIDFLVILFSTIVAVILTSLIIEFGNEGNMNGYVEAYIATIFISTFFLFFSYKNILIRHKIIGIFTVFIISFGVIYLWSEFAPRQIALIGLLIGYPFLIICIKNLYFRILRNNLLSS